MPHLWHYPGQHFGCSVSILQELRGFGLLATRMVTMGLIGVDCHNQLIGHLPACSRSGWRRTACMVGHYIRITPGFFCCHQIYSMVKRDLSQCSGSSTRAPHWQFLLENRDEKSLGSGSQNQGTLSSMLRGDSTQSSGLRPARLSATSMAVTDPFMSNDGTVLSECLLKVDI